MKKSAEYPRVGSLRNKLVAAGVGTLVGIAGGVDWAVVGTTEKVPSHRGQAGSETLTAAQTAELRATTTTAMLNWQLGYQGKEAPGRHPVKVRVLNGSVRIGYSDRVSTKVTNPILPEGSNPNQLDWIITQQPGENGQVEFQKIQINNGIGKQIEIAPGVDPASEVYVTLGVGSGQEKQARISDEYGYVPIGSPVPGLEEPVVS